VVKKRWKEDTPGLIAELIPVIDRLVDFSSQNIETRVKDYIEKNQLNMGNILNALRLCLVGAAKGPHLFDIIELIGKTETLQRIQSGIENIK